MSGEQYLDDGRSDGSIIGRASTSKVAFHGNTPVVQRSGSAQDAIGSSLYAAMTSSLIGTAALTQLAEIRATLVALGFWKGSS